MLLTVVTYQASGDSLLVGSNPGIGKCGQRLRISIPTENCIDDCQSGRPSDVADDMANLQVHLVQSLLHVLYVRRRHLYQTVSVPKQRSDGAHV